MEIKDKVVLITGASEGIGLATARLLSQRGARVSLAARSAEKLHSASAEMIDALVVPTDMRDPAAVRSMLGQVHAHYGRIDILVNNAGQGMHVPIEEADLGQYRAVLELNLVSVLGAMQAAIPFMREQGGGVIVNISSGTSKRIIPGLGPYSSSKYALNALSLTARIELGPSNIRVCLVYPGITATNFISNAAAARNVGNRENTMPVETPEQVAEKIAEAIETEAAETYADSIRPPS
ncbi:MAG: SDR family NAD(P)-dependent oxidoreductase [Chloroflexota bacterium]|nr:SDR family NAD(P)-dependent oxidoreductase [Chloroflexota bacterium]